MRLRFVDCRILRVHIGNHGGHDRDRRNHRCIVVVVSTTMRPLLLLSCHSHTLFRRAPQRSLLVRRTLCRFIGVIIVVIAALGAF